MNAFPRLALMLAFSAGHVCGQTGRIVGFAYDSLRGAPLRGALVTIANGSQVATTDSAGRFQMTSVSPGTYTLSLFHDVVDSLGLSGLTAHAVVGASSDTILFSVPSFATLWRRVCRTSAPRDHGFVFGILRDARRRSPVVGAIVRAQWSELALDGKKGVSERQWSGEVVTDSTGGYAVCGIPRGVIVRAIATKDSASTSPVPVDLGDAGVQRRDLVIGVGRGVGTVIGYVRDASGTAAANARVTVDTTPGVRTDSVGRFVARDVRAGTRAIATTAIGSAPVETAVDVYDGDTSIVTIDLHRVTTLAPTVVTASTVRRQMVSDLEYRRSLKVGGYMDSVSLSHYAGVIQAVAMMPSVALRGDVCYWIDGLEVDRRDFQARHPLDVAMLETHRQNDPTLPAQYRTCRPQPGSARRRTPQTIMLMWTKNWLP